MDNLVSKNYAKALISLASDSESLLEFRNDLLNISTIFNNSELMTFFNHPNILKDDKKKVIKELVTVNKMVLNYLYLLVDKNHMNYIDDIKREFLSLYNIELNVKLVECYSASELTSKQKDLLKSQLENKYKSEVEITYKVDETLLAGIKLYVSGQVIDNSATLKLAKLKEEVDNITLKIEV